MDALGIALFLAGLNFVLLNYVVKPIRRKWPELDLWFFDWIALATGFAIAWFAPLNALGDKVSNELLARILTGLLVGGGAELINVVFGSSPVVAGRQMRAAGGAASTAAKQAKRSFGW